MRVSRWVLVQKRGREQGKKKKKRKRTCLGITFWDLEGGSCLVRFVCFHGLRSDDKVRREGDFASSSQVPPLFVSPRVPSSGHIGQPVMMKPWDRAGLRNSILLVFEGRSSNVTIRKPGPSILDVPQIRTTPPRRQLASGERLTSSGPRGPPFSSDPAKPPCLIPLPRDAAPPPKRQRERAGKNPSFWDRKEKGKEN